MSWDFNKLCLITAIYFFVSMRLSNVHVVARLKESSSIPNGGSSQLMPAQRARFSVKDDSLLCYEHEAETAKQ